MRVAAFFAAAALASSCLAQAPGVYSIEWDDFHAGFTVNSPTAKWFYFGDANFVGDDGITTTSKTAGLRVVSATNPATGRPEFIKTVAQEGSSENPVGEPGGVDHVKWLVYANNTSSAGWPGFDALPNHELSFDAWISGQSYGNQLHPFGAAVADPDDDIRLATYAMPTIDFETFLVSDVFLTNKRIYAVYERLPFGRTPTHNYAAFTYVIPIASRVPGQENKVTVAYNPTANTMRWLVDGVEMFRVTRPGYRLPSRQYMVLDHGGTEEDVVCRQRDVGMGMFTLLDAAYPGQQALVQLSSAPGFYNSTALGFPNPQTFVDPISAHASRTWGEGAELRIRRVRVNSKITP